MRARDTRRDFSILTKRIYLAIGGEWKCFHSQSPLKKRETEKIGREYWCWSNLSLNILGSRMVAELEDLGQIRWRVQY